MLGGVVSRTVTMKLQALLLLLASVETQRTVVAPGGNVLPDNGEQTSTGLVSQMSEVVTTYVATAPTGLVHSTVTLVEHAMAGAVLSTTVMVNEQALLLLLASVARHRTVVTPGAKVLPETGEQTSDGTVSHTSVAVVT